MAAHLGVRYATVSEWATGLAATGLPLLADKPRRGRPLLIQAGERARLTALAGRAAPPGRSQWSLRLLAGKSVELGLCARLSASAAHGMLKKTSAGPSESARGAAGRARARTCSA